MCNIQRCDIIHTSRTSTPKPPTWQSMGTFSRWFQGSYYSKVLLCGYNQVDFIWKSRTVVETQFLHLMAFQISFKWMIDDILTSITKWSYLRNEWVYSPHFPNCLAKSISKILYKFVHTTNADGKDLKKELLYESSQYTWHVFHWIDFKS